MRIPSLSKALSIASLASFASLSALVFPSVAAAAPSQASTVVADFEVVGSTTGQGGYWYFYDDRTSQGESYVTTADSAAAYRWDSAAFVPGAGGGNYAVELGFVLGAKSPVCGPACTYPAQVGMGTSIAGGLEMDISGATAISFRAKAKAPIKVVFTVGTSDVKDNGFYAALVNVTTEWAKYTVPLAAGKDFAQPAWAAKKPFDASRFISLGWMIGKADNAGLTAGAFDLDDVVIEGWEAPLDPASIAAAPVSAAYPRIIRVGNRIRVDLGHGGMGRGGLERGEGRNPGLLEATDASGRTLGRTAYRADAREVELDLGSRAANGPIYLHVTPR
jgi:hypothetical protein